MSSALTATAAFDARHHRVAGFSCGNRALDRWLGAYAGQSQRRDAARTFVTVEPDGNVAGYYTLVAAQVEHERATAGVGRGLSRHFPIPVALLARLAVATPHQGTGLGRSLLLDALQRVLRASDELAVRAVTVEAIDERAASFYRHFGFEATGLAPNTLMVSLQAVRDALAICLPDRSIPLMTPMGANGGGERESSAVLPTVHRWQPSSHSRRATRMGDGSSSMRALDGTWHVVVHGCSITWTSSSALSRDPITEPWIPSRGVSASTESTSSHTAGYGWS